MDEIVLALTNESIPDFETHIIKFNQQSIHISIGGVLVLRKCVRLEIPNGQITTIRSLNKGSKLPRHLIPLQIIGRYNLALCMVKF